MAKDDEKIEVIDFSQGHGKTVSADPREIERLLGTYNTAMKVDTSPADNTPPQSQTQAPGQVNKATHFVRGPKKGQLKPQGYQQPSVAWRPNKDEVTELGGEIITGALLLMLTDILIPGLIVVLNNQFSKDKIDMELLQMTEKQKKTLEPVAERVASYIRLSANPIVIFIIANVGIYGLNFLMLKQLAKQKK